MAIRGWEITATYATPHMYPKTQAELDANEKFALMNARGRRYNPREVATALGCHLRTVQRALRSGQLKGWKTGNGHYWKVFEEDLQRWLETRKSL